MQSTHDGIDVGCSRTSAPHDQPPFYAELKRMLMRVSQKKVGEWCWPPGEERRNRRVWWILGGEGIVGAGGDYMREVRSMLLSEGGGSRSRVDKESASSKLTGGN